MNTNDLLYIDGWREHGSRLIVYQYGRPKIGGTMTSWRIGLRSVQTVLALFILWSVLAGNDIMQLACQHLYSASTNNLYSALLMYLSAHLGLHSLALTVRAGTPTAIISKYDLYCSAMACDNYTVDWKIDKKI